MAETDGIHRRSLLKGAAWSVPVLALATAAPAAAASNGPVTVAFGSSSYSTTIGGSVLVSGTVYQNGVPVAPGVSVDLAATSPFFFNTGRTATTQTVLTGAGGTFSTMMYAATGAGTQGVSVLQSSATVGAISGTGSTQLVSTAATLNFEDLSRYGGGASIDPAEVWDLGPRISLASGATAVDIPTSETVTLTISLAQATFGVATLLTPAGWTMTQTATTVTLTRNGFVRGVTSQPRIRFTRPAGVVGGQKSVTATLTTSYALATVLAPASRTLQITYALP